MGYTGHKFDTDIGLSYMQARYYDPVIGRFYSNDPIGLRDIHSFNRYQYVANNPYKYTDPTGMWKSKLDEIRENKQKRKDRQKKQDAKDSVKLLTLLKGNQPLLEMVNNAMRYAQSHHKVGDNPGFNSMGVAITIEDGEYKEGLANSTLWRGWDQWMSETGGASGGGLVVPPTYVIVIVTRSDANGRNVELNPGQYNFAAVSKNVPYIVIATKGGNAYFFAEAGKSEPLTEIEF